MLIALRKKIRAKLSATTAAIPTALIDTGADSREEPQPKLWPAMMMSPALAFFVALEAVLGKLLRVKDRQVLSGHDLVGVDVVAKDVDAPAVDGLELGRVGHFGSSLLQVAGTVIFLPILRGSVISP